MRVSRPEAVRILEETIARGKALLRRSPPDLRASTEAARNLRRDLSAWGKDGVGVLECCFGPTAAATLSALPLRYSTLELAREAVRVRLALLEEARRLAGRMHKAPEKRAVHPPASARPLAKPTRSAPTAGSKRADNRPYDFCLSFAGEDRAYAQKLHRLLTRRGLRVFYDTAEQSTLWGRNLYEYLADVYEHKAHFCVMFVSRHYVRKD